MTEHGESLYRFTRPRLAQSLLVAAALVALMAVLRLWWMPEHVLPVAFGLPLLVCIWMRDVRILWGMAAAFFAISAIKFGWLMPQSSADAGIVYRCIGLGMVLLDILAVSGIVHWLIRLRESLEEKNAELLGHNEQVTERDEEISHQNEELQTQAEELEQQSEELRVTNEELLRREHWLAALLKLSRTLTVKLSRQETLERICQTLAELGNGPIHAAAILERRGDAMHLVCSSGFEPAAEMTIRYASSFGALVLEKDRLGYLEDVSQRPDLVLPGRKGGAAFRSVLAAPLRVAGEAVGTIEVYGTQVQQWQAEQVQLLESLASQASISLEAEKLFEEVERERIRFEGIFNTLPIGAAIIDCGSSALRINPAGAALLRVPADFDFFGADAPHWRNYRDGVESPIADAPIKRALRGELVVNQELEFEFADQRVTLLCSAAPIRDRDGNIVSAVCGFADITSQKNLQRELENRRRAAEESSARKTRFLAAASHDIRTPANAINLLAELIKRGAQNPDLATDIPELTADLQSSATALVELVSDVLDLTRFDSGNVELSLSEFNLGTAIVEECRQLMPVALEKKIRLEIVPPAPPMRVRADRIKLLRIILNLVTNAIKYTDDGFVRVTASAGEDGRVRIAVADSGMGIDGQHIERIFDEFFQLSSAEPNRSKGMGLGLAICKRLADAMGAQIAVESGLGKGSTFTVIMPATAQAAGQELPVREQALLRRLHEAENGLRGLRGLRVLLVEDHSSTRRATSQILADHGVHVTEAADGRSALRLLYESNPQVLMLDMMLPDIDGAEVLKAVAAQRPRELRNVLVLTGDMTHARREEAAALGADAFIAKPIDLEQLLGQLRQGGHHDGDGQVE